MAAQIEVVTLRGDAQRRDWGWCAALFVERNRRINALVTIVFAF